MNPRLLIPPEGTPWLYQTIAFLSFAALVLTCLLHVIIAIAVFRDARDLRYSQKGPFLLPPIAWSLISLLTGILGLALYWVIHHSTLRPNQN